MTRSILLFALFILCSTGGEIIITHAMKIIGEPARLRPREILQFLGRALRNAWFWTGLPLLAASFYLLLVLLSWEPISLVIPASALNPYVFGTLAAKYFLGEQISPGRWAGVALVCAGVALVAVS
jgi:multidrug transporter EmrE-like cation transporter